MSETIEHESAGNGSVPKKGLIHDPLDGITPEMWEAAKPKIKGINPPPIIATGSPGEDSRLKEMFLDDEMGQFPKEYPAKWVSNSSPPLMPFLAKDSTKIGLSVEDLKEAVGIMRDSFKIELVIYHADGYFVGEFKMGGRPGKTKTGWKGLRDFIAKHKTTDFKVTYNGVTYAPEDNEKLFEKIFYDESKPL